MEKNFNGKFISIVVKKTDEKEPELENLVRTHNNTNNCKVIEINEGELADKLHEIAKNKFENTT